MWLCFRIYKCYRDGELLLLIVARSQLLGPSLFGGLDLGLDCGTGLPESCANPFEWLKRYRKYTASNLPRMRVFSCNTAFLSVWICAWSWFVIRDLMLTSEESSYGIHWLLLANSHTQGGATRFEKDATSWATCISMLLPTLTWAMLLFCWQYYRFLSPDRLSTLSLGMTLT